MTYNKRSYQKNPLLKLAAKLRTASTYSRKAAKAMDDAAEIAKTCPPDLQDVITSIIGKIPALAEFAKQFEKEAEISDLRCTARDGKGNRCGQPAGHAGMHSTGKEEEL